MYAEIDAGKESSTLSPPGVNRVTYAEIQQTNSGNIHRQEIESSQVIHKLATSICAH